MIVNLSTLCLVKHERLYPMNLRPVAQVNTLDGLSRYREDTLGSSGLILDPEKMVTTLFTRECRSSLSSQLVKVVEQR
jgi:hypothetical protein